jgi:hypothetical protein
MSFTIAATDNQFAVSTGSNVDTTANSSTFDNPPTGSKDLLITTKEGDPDPRLFEIGDTYDVSWGGQVGGGIIQDAVVVRSDAAPSEGGVVVFEGVDENGDLAQVIWTPDFDLEGWYSDNFNPSMEPQFYTEDTQPTYTHSFVCFSSETRIQTPYGARSVGKLNVGDLVTTEDAGDIKVLWVGHRLCRAVDENAPVVFYPGSIGNSRTLRLSQQHRVLIKSPLAELYFGQNEVLAPAKAFANGCDVRIVPGPRIFYVHLLLEDHHLLRAEGALCESLFLGDQAIKNLYGDPNFEDLHKLTAGGLKHRSTARPVLKMNEAQLLLRNLTASKAAAQRLKAFQ